MEIYSIKEVVNHLTKENPFAIFKNDYFTIKNIRYGSDNVYIPAVITTNSNIFLNKNISYVESNIFNSDFYLSNEMNKLEETSYIVDLDNICKLKDIDSNNSFPIISDMIDEKVNIVTNVIENNEEFIIQGHFEIDYKLSKNIDYYSCKKVADVLINSIRTFKGEKENNKSFEEKLLEHPTFKGLTGMYFKEAEEEMEKSNCLRRKYGAVLVSKDNEILSKACNSVPEGDKPCKEKCYRESIGINHGERYEVCKTVHAEQACLIKVNPEKIKGSTLYLVGRESDGSFINNISCCSLCLRMLKYAGVSKVVYQLNNSSYKQIELRKEE